MRFDKLSINSIGKTIASMKLKRFVKDLETNIGKKLIHDAVIMEGFLDITNGNTVIHGKNSIVDQGLAGIINWASGSAIPTTLLGSYSFGGLSSYMVIGSDTSTGTTNGMTTLATPIGTAPGTKPNTQSGINSNPSPGQWQVQWTATWNAGTVSGMLGEVGLYLYIQPSLATFQTNISPSPNLFSRMASKDGKFTNFLINTAVPLSIAWSFRLTYAT